MAFLFSFQKAAAAAAALGLLCTGTACDRPAALKGPGQESSSAVAVQEAPEVPQGGNDAILLKVPGPYVTAGSEGNTVLAEAKDGMRFAWVVNGGVITGGARESVMTYRVDEDATSVRLLCRTTDTAGREWETSSLQTVVPPPVLEAFEVKPEVITAGSSGILGWSAREIKSLTLEPGGQDVISESGTVVKPVETTTFTLSAMNLAGTVVRRQATLKVVAAPEIRSLSSEGSGQVGKSMTITATFANGRAELWNGTTLLGSSVDSPWAFPVNLREDLSLTFKVTNEAGAWTTQTLNFRQGEK
jgi:hypothetical protein